MRYLIAILLLLAILAPAMHASAQRGNLVITGTMVIDENTVDPISGNRGMYGIRGNLTVEDNATLIVKNATLYFASPGNASMEIRGTLIVENGTISEGASNLTMVALGNQSAVVRVENGTIIAYRLESYYRKISLFNSSMRPAPGHLASGIYLSHSTLISRKSRILEYPTCAELYFSTLSGDILLENCTYGVVAEDSSEVLNVTISNGSYGVYASASSAVTVDNVTLVNSSVGIYVDYSSGVKADNISVNGSIHAVEIYESSVNLRNLSSDFGGIYVFDSKSMTSLALDNCTVSSGYVILARNGTFSLQGVSEVIAYNSTINIANSLSHASNFVMAISSEIFVSNVSLIPEDMGFLVRKGVLVISNSSISSASYGIKAFGENLSMSDVNISHSNFAVWVEESNGTVQRCNFESNSFGLWLKRSRFTVQNSAFINDTSGLMLDGAIHSSVVNNTFVNCGVYLHADIENVEESYLTNNISGNVVNGKPLVFLKNASGVHVDYGGEVICVNCTDAVVEDINISNVDVGVSVLLSKNVTVSNITTINDWHGIYSTFSTGVRVLNSTSINNSWAGVYFYNVSHSEVLGVKSIGNHIGFLACCLNDSLISQDEFSRNYRGFEWDRSYRDDVVENTFRNNSEYAVFLDGCFDLRIWNNSFLWNHNSTTRFSPETVQAFDNGHNAWNTSVGNYWLDWAMNNDSNDVNGDGIVDYAYPIDGGARDFLPVKEEIPEFNVFAIFPLLLILLVGRKVFYGRKA